MANGPRNLIVLSDGTGNSAAKQFKTNVWRLYQALELTDGTQLAVFGDGVGTSSTKVVRALGLALGIGVKRNVLNLYKFLCRNYTAGDCIWVFGFSRGAFTVRVLVGLLYHEGLVSFNSEAELNRNALAAYRAYRREAFKTWIPWVRAGRFLRDLLIAFWNAITGARSYEQVREETVASQRNKIEVHFVGVWDTVVAYGLPIDELTLAVDKWVWPMKFRDTALLSNVRHARHALSLDDERRTFHPVPWDETKERLGVEKQNVAEGRLQQVWFAGVHSDVGGGYPDDGLSLVPLCWMIEQAEAEGLRFEPTLVAQYAALASPTGRMYDSRGGFGVLWRYQPRDVELLLGSGNTPLVHGSVMTRMARGGDGYAPISLPQTIAVVPPVGPPVPFDANAVVQSLNQAQTRATQGGLSAKELAELQDQQRVLQDTGQLVAWADAELRRAALFEVVRDTVWWRRVVYFVSLSLVLIAAGFPLLAQYLRLGDVSDQINDWAGGSVGWTLGIVKGFLPGFAEPWLTAVRRNPAWAALIAAGLLASLGLSGFLQRRICDRARAAWNLRPRAGGNDRDRLAPTGQRRALAKATLAFTAFAIAVGVLSDERWLVIAFAAAALLLGAWWAYRRWWPAGPVDPENPNWALFFARKARTSKPAVRAYRFVAQKLAPAAFLVVSALFVAALAHRAVFDLQSTGGFYCKLPEEAKDQKRQKYQVQKAAGTTAQETEKDEVVGPAQDLFPTNATCHRTGLQLIAGRKYRIVLEMAEGPDGEWFDKGRHSDVGGFTVDSLKHVVASPFKRWWRENWFQPIARIGEVGNNEHVLQPVAPLPTFRPTDGQKCPAAEQYRTQAWSRDIPSPASEEFKRAQIDCDKDLVKTRQLIADITADATGELFLYVNDAVFAWDGREQRFYLNNGGKAKVTVTRIFGTPVIEAPVSASK